ncbi:MFS transporter [Streptomyces sp. NRRL WC-3742]|uniref:MFS transporter n=1 Tax=Streptomyces sp. NRRL WC-3742 TaxID=1463934 RepID=UPI0006919D3F|nr:MFS transporter [Streptomyces sp. NRRL WC-3742]
MTAGRYGPPRHGPLQQGPPQPGPFRRDRLTAAAYSGLAVFAYLLYALGPVLPLLRQDLRLSYQTMSLHSTAFAAGAVVTNLVFERLRGRFGYRRLFWPAACALAVGAALLATGSNVAVTLTAATVGGIGGSLLQTTALAVLAEHHGELRERALLEANAGASATALLAPLVIGALQAFGAAWNWSLLLPALAVAALYALLRREPLRPGAVTAPQRQHEQEDGSGRLPGAFWILSTLCAVVVATEFCVVFFGSPLLSDITDLTDHQAATLMALFYGGTLLGRLAGSRVTGATRWPTPRLVLATLVVTGAGVLALWTAATTWMALVGLFVSGLGIANLFPLTLSLAVGAAPGRTGRATAYVQLLVGAAIMLAPLLLGSLSDRLGIRSAFSVAGALVLLAVLLLSLSGRDATGQAPAPLAHAARTDPRGATEHADR